jgi:uncharacterized protein YjiS (DUF1127 family)
MTDWFHLRPPGTLHKFKAYSTSLDRKRVRRMLTRGEVYFARAPEFNDPFELKPRWVSRGRNSAELRTMFRNEALKDAGGNRNQRRALVARALENATPDRIRQNQNAYHKVLETKVDIFCMSGTKEDLLMWAHYAQSHTGLCIHIDATRMPFSAAVAVDYSDNYPAISMPAEDSDEAFRVCLLTKAVAWKSESEYRLLRLRLPGCSSLDLKWNGPIAAVPLNVFTGVTLGARMPAAFHRSFVKPARRASHPFEVWVAKVDDTAFRLDFERLA